MNLRRVLLIGKDNLFTDGLEILLTKRYRREVTRVSFTDTNLLIAEISLAQPQTIIFNTCSSSQPLEIFNQLGSYPSLQLIVVNEFNNKIIIYENPASTHLLANDERANANIQLFN